MTKKDYMRRFSNCVRWRLSPGEAEDVINDYEELFSMRHESEDEICRELGSPYSAARLLGNTSSCLRWTAVFTVLALCLFSAFLSLFIQGVSTDMAALLFMICSILSLIWLFFKRAFLTVKRRFGRASFSAGQIPSPYTAFPRALPVALFALFAAAVLTALLLRHFFHILPDRQLGSTVSAILRILGAFLFFFGFTFLIKSRTSNRRYIAVYTFSLTLLLLCAISMRILTSMDLVDRSILEVFLTDYVTLCAAGAVLTGVSLC